MKLSTKLISSFTVVIVLLLLIGLASQYFNEKIKNRVVDESQAAFQISEISGEMEAYIYESFINAQYYLEEPYRATLEENLQDSLTSIESVKRRVGISLQGMNLAIKRIERLLNQENNINFTSEQARQDYKNTLGQLRKGIEFYNSLMQQLLNYERGNFDQARELLTVTLEPYYNNKLLPLVERFRSQIRANLSDQVGMLDDRLDRYSRILWIATLIAFVFSLVLAYLLYRSITKPIHSLVQATEEVGRGNLEKRIDVQSTDEIGQLGKSFNRMAENLNRITFTKEYVDNIIESMGDALIVTNKEGNIIKVNSATATMLGYRGRELIGEPLAEVFADGGQPELFSIDKFVVIENYETNFVRKNGKAFPVNLSKAVIKNADGSVQGLVYIASDITERKKQEKMIKESLEEKEILLAEIHHRVKNNLAVISGLLQMQRWETENSAAKNVLQDSQLRVKSIALVHEKLYQSENLSSIQFEQYVEELIKGINKTFSNSQTDISFHIDIEPIVFSINKAIPCSLLLNELIVNVHKHAFDHVDKGEVRITLWKENSHVRLVVKDNGKGLKELSGDKAKASSLGMSLIQTLVSQLEGDIDFYNDDGATFDITFKEENI